MTERTRPSEEPVRGPEETRSPGSRKRGAADDRRRAWLLALASWIGFAGVAAVVLSGTVDGLDRSILHAVAGRGGPIEVVASEITALGSISTVLALALVCAAFVWRTSQRRLAAWLVVLPLVAWAAPEILKAIVERPRPAVELWATEVRSPSFPSGHALQSALVWGAAAIAVRRTVSGRIGRAAMALGALLPLLIGASRTALGVHYPTDVLGGWLAGWALLGAAVALAPRLD